MLSVLIPIYNFDVRPLLEALHRQCLRSGVDFELICFDDGSTDSFLKQNASIAQYTHCTYEVLPQNVGRSRIRNLLADAAIGEWLLFLDCDSQLASEQFIENYLSHRQDRRVLCGGTIYAPHPPKDQRLHLHWLYGSKREALRAEQRMRKDQMGFTSNNFMIQKIYFNQIRFEEDIRQYGHEDTLFGLQAHAKEFEIFHLDNPVEHLGLEPWDVFLRKHRQAIENLLKLQKEHPGVQTKLTKTFQQLERWGMAPALRFFHQIFGKVLYKQLGGSSPNLRLMDLYRLGERSLMK
ncbi:MAG: glycosyltransferase family 2 protein [Bacteroidota bacterium]